MPANAQIASFNGSTIGSGTGSGSYNSGSYAISGAGTGVSGISDSCFFYNTQASGNTEIIAQVSSLTAPGLEYAETGLMIRDSLNAGAAGAFVSVSPDNGVNFSARTADNGTASTTVGPSVAAPVYLRLVVSGTSVAGYESSDGTNWLLVGKTTITLSSAYYIGFCAASNGNQSCTGSFGNVSILTNVPQRSANMLLWLRADAGVQSSGGNVTAWLDQSGNGMNATGVSGKQPTLLTGSNGINGLPAINFASTSSQYLQLGSGFKDFSQGCTVFVVLNPATIPGGFVRILNLSTSTGSANGLDVCENSTSTLALQVCDSSGSTATYASTAFSLNNQLCDFVQSGTSATGYTNGVPGSPNTSMYSIASTMRSYNYIGQYGSSGYNFNGKIAEMIVYNIALSTAQRQAVESYLIGKYALGASAPNLPQLGAPTISPANAVVTASQSVTISAAPGAVTYYSINGASYVPYTNPFTIASADMVNGSASITAYSIQPGYQDSGHASATIQVDSGASAVLQTGLEFWFRADNGVNSSPPANGDPVSSWADLSGNDNNASQTPGNQPVWQTNQINGLPAVSFSSAQSLKLPSVSPFTTGATVFIVAEQTMPANTTGHFLDFGVGVNQNDVWFLNVLNNQLGFYIYYGTTQGDLLWPNGLNSGQFQLIEAQQTGAGSGSLWINGVAGPSGSLQNMANVTYSTNFISEYTAGGFNLNGQIAEILVYNTSLSAQQRQAIESYLEARYGLKVNAPQISPSSGMRSVAPQTVTIAADPGAGIVYTLDGSTPAQSNGTVTNGKLYSGPFALTSTAQVQAIAFQHFGSNYTSSPVASVNIALDTKAGNVPQNGLLFWLRGDLIQTGSGSPAPVTSWLDVSSSGNTASQTNSLNQPTLASSAINGLPAVNFTPGSNGQFLSFPSGFANFASGASAFLVTKPSAPANGARFFDLGNGLSSNNMFMSQPSTSGFDLHIFNGSVDSSVSAANVINVGQFQLIEATYNGTATGALYLDGAQQAQSTALKTALNTTRSNNFIGQASGGGNYFSGQIAEALLYNRLVSSFERSAIEAYLIQRFALTPSIASPAFSVPSGTTFGVPSQVAIAAPDGTTVYVTTDGSTPTTSSPTYTQPLTVSYSQTIKAMAVLNGVQSSVSSASYTLDATKYAAPSSSDTTAPRINVQIPTPAQ